MKVVRCLYVDDTPAHQARYARSVEIAWQGQGMRLPIEVITVASPEEAIRRINESEFQLLIVDILYREKGRSKEQLPLGMQLITDVRQNVRGKKIGIIALSMAGEWSKDAMMCGADEFLPKQFLDSRDRGLRVLGETLVEVLRKHGNEPVATESVEIVFDQNDKRVVWMVEWVGRKALVSLASDVLEGSINKIQVGFVRAGLSGAAVVRLDCSLEVEEGSVPADRKILLKLTRDPGALSGELSKIERARNRFPFHLFVPAISKEVHECDGWYGIGLDFLDRASTLHDSLAVLGRPIERIEDGLSGLFLHGGLREVYRRFRKGEVPEIAFRDMMTPARVAGVLLSLEELLPLVKKYDKDGLFEEELVQQFIWSSGRFSRSAQKASWSSYYSLAHGDLHAGNILVDRSSVFRLVDAGSITELPWPADLARLFVDLIMVSWDAGAYGHEWEKIGEWTSLIDCLLSPEIVQDGVDGQNLATFSVLAWLRKNIGSTHPEVFGRESEYEFLLAVAVECLRSSYRRQDLSAPKRVLGLLGFCMVLRKAIDYFDTCLGGEE